MLLELPNGESLQKGLLGLGKEFRVSSEYEQISLKSFFYYCFNIFEGI